MQSSLWAAVTHDAWRGEISAAASDTNDTAAQGSESQIFDPSVSAA